MEHKKVGVSPSPSRVTPSIENTHDVTMETGIPFFCSVTMWLVESGVHPMTQSGEETAHMPAHTAFSVLLRYFGTWALRKDQLNAPPFSTEDEGSIHLSAEVLLCPHEITGTFFPGPLLSQQRPWWLQFSALIWSIDD